MLKYQHKPSKSSECPQVIMILMNIMLFFASIFLILMFKYNEVPENKLWILTGMSYMTIIFWIICFLSVKNKLLNFTSAILMIGISFYPSYLLKDYTHEYSINHNYDENLKDIYRRNINKEKIDTQYAIQYYKKNSNSLEEKMIAINYYIKNRELFYEINEKKLFEMNLIYRIIKDHKIKKYIELANSDNFVSQEEYKNFESLVKTIDINELNTIKNIN